MKMSANEPRVLRVGNPSTACVLLVPPESIVFGSLSVGSIKKKHSCTQAETTVQSIDNCIYYTAVGDFLHVDGIEYLDEAFSIMLGAGTFSISYCQHGSRILTTAYTNQQLGFSVGITSRLSVY